MERKSLFASEDLIISVTSKSADASVPGSQLYRKVGPIDNISVLEDIAKIFPKADVKFTVPSEGITVSSSIEDAIAAGDWSYIPKGSVDINSTAKPNVDITAKIES